MNIWKITLKNIKAKLSYTIVSIFILALSSSLLLGIKQLKNSFEYQITNNLGDIDLVIGAKGSPLQLVLSSVLHLDNPTGNISFTNAQKISKNPLIKSAVPISYGDNYKGYRIIGTKTEDFMRLYKATIETGRITDKNFEVVIGSAIAQKLKLSIGDTFLSAHGLIENEVDVHDSVFTIVGILKPTQKIIDRLIICPLATVWKAHESHTHNRPEEELHKTNHDHDHDTQHQQTTTHEDKTDKEITAMLISFKNLSALLTLPKRINEKTNMQAALPKYELTKLYKFTGIGLQTISWIAYLILGIAGMTIFMNMYKMITERAFDLALLRTYGASNFQLIKMVTYEGLIIGSAAFVSALIITKIGVLSLGDFLQEDYQQTMIRPLPIQELFEIMGIVMVLIVLSIIFAIYPIIKLNISTILSNEK